MAFKTYKLSSDKLKQIARLCVQEQGCIAGVKAEASQAANLLETNAVYRKKYGSDIYTFMRNSGWYYKASYFMDNGTASDSAIEAVKDVLINGKRVFPQYVDEHDCLADIKWVKTNGLFINKNDKSKYVQGKTVIANNMGSTYTFWAFPAPGCDPFGYTTDAYDYVMNNGGSPEPDTKEDTGSDLLSLTVKLPELYKDCPKSRAVKLWRLIIGESTKYATFGDKMVEATKDWQRKHGLNADGIVGRRTWTEGLNTLK